MFYHDRLSILPTVSIIIPTLNEVRYIGQALQGIVDNELPKHDLEVLVVDGGSQDGTLDIVRQFSERIQLHIIIAPSSTVYHSLNIGLERARGIYFVRVDARSIIPPNYIRSCIGYLLHDPLVECAGGIQLQFGETLVAKSIAWVTRTSLGTGGAKFRTATRGGFVDTVYLGVYRTHFLRALGGFEDGSDYVSEDAFINQRIRERGGKIYLDAQLLVKYPAKETFRALIKQYIIYGAAKAFLVRKHRRLTSIRQIIPLLFVTGWLVLFLGTFFSWIHWKVLLAGAVSYSLLLVIGNYRSPIINTQQAGVLWARIIATTCIHFAWPLGFFLSLISPKLHKRLVRIL